MHDKKYGKGKHHGLKDVNFLGKPTAHEKHEAKESWSDEVKEHKHLGKTMKPTQFVREQYEDGVEKKLKDSSKTSLWYPHKSK